MRVESIETLSCDAGWRNYHYVKLVTTDGVIGWSEFDEGFGSPGVSTAIEALSALIIDQPVNDHERIYQRLFAATRPASGGVVGQAIGAIENALLDAKAKSLGVPCYELLGGKIRDRIRVYWSHCGTWRVVYPDHFGNPVAVRTHAVAERRHHYVVGIGFDNFGIGFATNPTAIELNGLGPHTVEAKLFEFCLCPVDDALIARGAHAPWPDFSRDGFDNIDRQIVLQRSFTQRRRFGDYLRRNERRSSVIRTGVFRCAGREECQ